MIRNMLSEEELDDLLSLASATRPVSRAALDDESVDAALDDAWRRAESNATRRVPSRSARRPAYRRRVAAVAGAAAVVGVASLVGVEGLAGGSGGSGLPLAVSPAAAAQLNSVAHAAAVQPGLSAGQWQYVERTEQTGSGPNSTTVRVQDWFAANGTERERVTSDGTVTSDTVYTDPTSTSAPTPGVNEASPPNDVQTLLSDIGASVPASAPSSPSAYPAYYWVDLSDILLSSTSAQLRSLAFTALKYVPDTTVLGSQTDQLGRSGTAISFSGDPNDTTGIHESYTVIVSPSTGDFLESYDTLTAASGSTPAGTVVYRVTNTQQSVVDSDTALPGGGTEPLAPASQTATTTAAQTTTTAPQGQ